MTGKEFLQEIQQLDTNINISMMQLHELRVRLDSVKAVRYDRTKVQTSRVDTIADSVSRLETLERNIVSKVASLEEKRNAFIEAINQINDQVSREIITRRAVYNMGWDDIADAMNYSRSLVCHKYGKALKELDQINI